MKKIANMLDFWKELGKMRKLIIIVLLVCAGVCFCLFQFFHIFYGLVCFLISVLLLLLALQNELSVERSVILGILLICSGFFFCSFISTGKYTFLFHLIGSITIFFFVLPVEYGLFALSIVVCCVFILCPLILFDPEMAIVTSSFLSSLKASEYKATYIESLGSLLGSFLAITGALWVERRVKVTQDKEQDSVTARIIYYDLSLAVKELHEILGVHKVPANIRLQKPEDFKDADFKRKILSYKIAYDPNWIRNVAELPGKFSSEDIEQIYKLYGKLEEINRKIQRVSSNNATNEKLKDIYTSIYEFLNDDMPGEIGLKKTDNATGKTAQYWVKLKRLAHNP